MTLNTCLSLVDSLLPNALPQATKCRWLSELEGRIRVELLGQPAADQTPLTVSDTSDPSLIVPFPYDQVYWMYLLALIEYVNGDYARYENGAALFNAAYHGYAKYLIRAGRGEDA